MIPPTSVSIGGVDRARLFSLELMLGTILWDGPPRITVAWLRGHIDQDLVDVRFSDGRTATASWRVLRAHAAMGPYSVRQAFRDLHSLPSTHRQRSNAWRRFAILHRARKARAHGGANG